MEIISFPVNLNDELHRISSSELQPESILVKGRLGLLTSIFEVHLDRLMHKSVRLPMVEGECDIMNGLRSVSPLQTN
ncbi:hypothetical protein [Weissella kandleri]|uniref:hypothetical protein n=1 Tax=Weissella kandleri TaxID=1616 RepID=UPI0012ECEEFE|nr:hypothetical protein [Weissella kandleri]